MAAGPTRIALVHDARRFDGHYRMFEILRHALRAAGRPVASYSCIDPSQAEEYPHDGTVVWGRRIPPGGDLERGVNRFFPVFTRQLRSIPADVVHVMDVHLASLAQFRPDVVVSIADLAKRTTRWYPRGASFVHNHGLRYLARSRAVVCHTEFVRGEILRTLPCPPERVVVAPLYSLLPEGPVRSAPPPPTPAHPWTLLAVSTDRPHKNLGLFLELLRSTDDRYRGLLVSHPTPATRRRIAELGLTARLTVVTGGEAITDVYRRSEVLIFPSRHEGFGLPLVEAMGQGLPVVASDRTSIPEVVGAAGPLLNPEDPGPWLRALDRLTAPGAWEAASRRSREQARTFGPERTVRGLLTAYRGGKPAP